VDDELGRRDVRREAVVFRHVADALADLRAFGRDVEAEHFGAALARGGQTQEDLDQGGLAGAVGTDESGHTGSDVHGQPVESGHPREPLAQAFGRDHSHRSEGSDPAHIGSSPRRAVFIPTFRCRGRLRDALLERYGHGYNPCVTPY